MSKETKDWWEYNALNYQKMSKIPIEVHYGPGSPGEKHYKLLGDVKGKRVLEIGCGGAQCSIAFAKQGAKVTGVDISTEELKFAKNLAKKNKVKIEFYQGDIKKLLQIKSNSQDIVFSAWALFYVDDLMKCFKEVKRVLKKNGLFVFSSEHPIYENVDPKTLKLRGSYFKTGKYVETYSYTTKKFVTYRYTVGGLYNILSEAGLFVEKIIEPDSRKRHSADPWYNLWDYKPKLLKMVPPTIIFKCRKR